MPESELRETQKPTAAIRQRTLNFRLRLNLISRLMTQSQNCEWLPKLQNPRRNQYKPVLVLQTLFFDTGTQTDRPGAVKTIFQLPYIIL